MAHNSDVSDPNDIDEHDSIEFLSGADNICDEYMPKIPFNEKAEPIQKKFNHNFDDGPIQTENFNNKIKKSGLFQNDKSNSKLFTPVLVSNNENQTRFSSNNHNNNSSAFISNIDFSMMNTPLDANSNNLNVVIDKPQPAVEQTSKIRFGGRLLRTPDRIQTTNLKNSVSTEQSQSQNSLFIINDDGSTIINFPPLKPKNESFQKIETNTPNLEQMSSENSNIFQTQKIKILPEHNLNSNLKNNKNVSNLNIINKTDQNNIAISNPSLQTTNISNNNPIHNQMLDNKQNTSLPQSEVASQNKHIVQTTITNQNTFNKPINSQVSQTEKIVNSFTHTFDQSVAELKKSLIKELNSTYLINSAIDNNISSFADINSFLDSLNTDLINTLSFNQLYDTENFNYTNISLRNLATNMNIALDQQLKPIITGINASSVILKQIQNEKQQSLLNLKKSIDRLRNDFKRHYSIFFKSLHDEASYITNKNQQSLIIQNKIKKRIYNFKTTKKELESTLNNLKDERQIIERNLTRINEKRLKLIENNSPWCIYETKCKKLIQKIDELYNEFKDQSLFDNLYNELANAEIILNQEENSLRNEILEQKLYQKLYNSILLPNSRNQSFNPSFSLPISPKTPRRNPQ